MIVVRNALSLVLAALASIVLTTSVASPARAQIKLGIVDFQRAMNETEDGRRAKDQMNRMRKERQQALDSKQQLVQKMKDDIEKQQKVLSKEALGKRLEEYQKAFMELQQAYMEYQRELAQEEAKMTKKIVDRMQEIVRQIGQAEGYSLIVEANEGGVVWAPSSSDLTERVIQKYNADHAQSKGGKGGGGKGGAGKGKKGK